MRRQLSEEGRNLSAAALGEGGGNSTAASAPRAAGKARKAPPPSKTDDEIKEDERKRITGYNLADLARLEAHVRACDDERRADLEEGPNAEALATEMRDGAQRHYQDALEVDVI